MRVFLSIVLAILSTSILAISPSTKVVRATDLNGKVPKSFFSTPSNEEVIIEFKSGDQIPLSFVIKGDLIELSEDLRQILKIQKDFFIKIKNQEVKMSLDGKKYKLIKNSINGSFSIGADLGSSHSVPGIINAILSINLE